ncbi:alpha/beta fold hydrolase [Myroides odoratimimus]|uniref:alpha/beta fold hydrolase n=1 Tax=Myroides odoratimimus TaxID=76832 RepID=UPI000A71B9CF|nr:alpha/beta hydrolase [Myroides odoratimimus]
MKQFSYKKIGIIFLLLFQLSLIEVFAQTPSKIELEYFTIENTPLYIINTNDIDLAIRYKKGQGIPIVFIHGSWDDHNSWLPVAEELIKTTTNPIILYDRRGHSASSPDKEQGTISMDVQDAVSLLDALQIKKAHFIGHSYGANITIELANNHADRVESIVLYEPPIFGMLKGQTEYKQILSEVQNEMQKSKTLLEQGHIEQGTFNFIEKVAFGKGSWYSVFDQRARNTMTASYTTWLDQANDPERLNIKPEILNQFNGKITLITGL